MKKVRFLLSLLLCLALVLGTCTCAFADQPVELKLVIYGDNNDATQAFIDNKLRPRLIDELNIDLDLEFMSWGAADQVRTMAMSGEAFGFMFDPNANPWSADGIMATIPLEKIEELAPTYLEMRGDNGFEWCKDPEGNIIALPFRTMPNVNIDGIAVRNDMLKAVGLDYTQIKTYDDYISAAQKVKAAMPEVETGHFGRVPEKDNGIPEGTHLTGIGALLCSGPGLLGTSALAVIDDGDPESDEVISLIETEWFANHCRNAKKLVDLGLRSSDPMVDNNLSAAWTSGNSLASSAYTQMIYKYDELSGVEGSEVRVIRFEGAQDVMVLDYNWTIALSIEEEKNVDHWLRLINWIYESEEHFRFITIGEEGVDWEYAEDGITINDLSDVSLIHDWMLATDWFEKISTEKYDAALVEEYWNLNSNAIKSKAMGFVFDTREVETEVALLSAIIQEELDMFTKGLKDYDTDFAATLQRMKDAGLDKYIAEVQRQFTEHMAK